MKRILLLLTITYSSFSALKAQTAYTPMNFDTTCFWVNSCQVYNNGPLCEGIVTSNIEKDTTINFIHYFKINSYFNNVSIQSNCMFYLGYIYQPHFIREDTSARTILMYDGINPEIVLVDFSLHVNDILTLCNVGFAIDSVSIDTFMNVPSRVQSYHNLLGGKLFTMEGIGNSVNFPFCGFGEWGTPYYTLQYYCKNGQQLYPNNNVGTCIKPAPLAVVNSINNAFEFSYFFNTIKLKELDETTQLEIYNTVGQKLYEENIHASYYQKNLSNMLASGMYIVLIQNTKIRQVYKVEIQ